MIRSIVVGRKKYSLDKNRVIGEGGEAVIFGFGSKAIKVYRNPDRRRAEKLADFFLSVPHALLPWVFRSLNRAALRNTPSRVH